MSLTTRLTCDGKHTIEGMTNINEKASLHIVITTIANVLNGSDDEL